MYSQSTLFEENLAWDEKNRNIAWIYFRKNQRFRPIAKKKKFWFQKFIQVKEASSEF